MYLNDIQPLPDGVVSVIKLVGQIFRYLTEKRKVSTSVNLLVFTSNYNFPKFCLFVLWFNVPVNNYGHSLTILFLGRLRPKRLTSF